MEDAFFSSAEMRAVKAPSFALPMCGICGLYTKCKSPKMPVTGDGRLKTLIVAEAPGAEEDDKNKQLVGRAGQKLEDVLDSLGVRMRRDCWLTNAVICRPPDNNLGNKKAVEYCRPNLLRTVRELKPEKIILLGAVAVKSYIGHLWKEDPGGIGKWVGWQIPNHKPNAWICPTYHPSYVCRSEKDKEGPIIEAMFKQHLREAFELDGRPWPNGPPDFPDRVNVLYNGDEAADRIRRYRGGLVAFDFEFTPLKPDPEFAELVCCSVCWNGKETVAFPWVGRARQAMCELLEDPDIGKIGSNIKIEHRWCLARLKTEVKNWKWDVMNTAHTLDSRPGITGLKFQAFVNLGQPVYNQAVEPFLKPEEKGGNAMNRIRDVDLSILLRYCGVDSLLEFLLAKRQMRILGGSNE